VILGLPRPAGVAARRCHASWASQITESEPSSWAGGASGRSQIRMTSVFALSREHPCLDRHMAAEIAITVRWRAWGQFTEVSGSKGSSLATSDMLMRKGDSAE
jgi:hypothetical protein